MSYRPLCGVAAGAIRGIWVCHGEIWSRWSHEGWINKPICGGSSQTTGYQYVSTTNVMLPLWINWNTKRCVSKQCIRGACSVPVVCMWFFFLQLRQLTSNWAMWRLKMRFSSLDFIPEIPGYPRTKKPLKFQHSQKTRSSPSFLLISTIPWDTPCLGQMSSTKSCSGGKGSPTRCRFYFLCRSPNW